MTGEMGERDIKPGGEYAPWADAIKEDLIKLQRGSKGRVKFIEMRPFDAYQGPFGVIEIDKTPMSVWDAQDLGDRVLWIEDIDMYGSVYELIGKISLSPKGYFSIAEKIK